MPKCDLCGQDAGFLKQRHKECERRHTEGITQITALGKAAALSGAGLDEFAAKAGLIARDALITPDQLRRVYAAAWESAVEASLDDGMLSPEEEHALFAYRDHFGFSQQDLDAKGSYTRVVRAAVIRDLLEDKLPARVTLDGPSPFNLQKTETLLWLFRDVAYYEERTRTTYRGGVHGASFRIAKGVYYRVGGFRGNPVVTAELVHVATGTLGITQKHIYFAGDNKAFRVPFQKIVAFTPFSDGVGIQRDATTARPQIFVTGDGWFTYNLLQNIARIGAA
jgi:hypothetical protein